MSIWPIDRTYQVLPLCARLDLGAMAVKGYSAFSKAPASLSDCLVSCTGHLLGWGASYLLAEKQSVYSITLADWADYKVINEEKNWYKIISAFKEDNILNVKTKFFALNYWYD